MNKNMLRVPLLKSATLLVVVSLLVYLTATSSEGSLWNSLATLCIATFRIVQLSVGLIVALFFCLAVLVGIFLGCAAMVSRESARRMTEQLRDMISDRLLYVRSLVIRDNPVQETGTAQQEDSAMVRELHAIVDGSLELIREDQLASDQTVEWLMERLDQIEKVIDPEMLVHDLERLKEQVQETGEATEQIRAQVVDLQGNIDKLQSVASQNDQTRQAVNEMSGRVDALEKGIVSMQEGLAKMTGNTDGGAEAGTVDHRLFTHFNNKAMKEKVEQLVTETLGKDMSYAQVIEYLVEHTSTKTNEIISAHPSLAKDYIRHRRNNG